MAMQSKDAQEVTKAVHAVVSFLGAGSSDEQQMFEVIFYQWLEQE